MHAHVLVLPGNHRPHTAHAYYIILDYLSLMLGRSALEGEMSEME